MRVGEFYFLDTNILLEATDRKGDFHAEAFELFSVASKQGAHLAISGQVAREYHVVATRPVAANGLGLEAKLGWGNVENFLERCVMLEETKAVFESLSELIEAYGINGKKAHDANIVATMKAHRVENLVTLNPRDFKDYHGLRLCSPSEALSDK